MVTKELGKRKNGDFNSSWERNSHIGVRKLQMAEGWRLRLGVLSHSGFAGVPESPAELDLWIISPSSPQSMAIPSMNLALLCC